MVKSTAIDRKDARSSDAAGPASAAVADVEGRMDATAAAAAAEKQRQWMTASQTAIPTMLLLLMLR